MSVSCSPSALSSFPQPPVQPFCAFPPHSSLLSAVLSSSREREGQWGEATASMDVWAADPAANPLTARAALWTLPPVLWETAKTIHCQTSKRENVLHRITTQRYRFAVSPSPGIALSWFHLSLSELRRSKTTRETANAEINGGLWL